MRLHLALVIAIVYMVAFGMMTTKSSEVYSDYREKLESHLQKGDPIEAVERVLESFDLPYSYHERSAYFEVLIEETEKIHTVIQIFLDKNKRYIDFQIQSTRPIPKLPFSN